MTIISAVLLLFFVMGPLGNMPLFLAALKNVAPEQRTKVIFPSDTHRTQKNKEEPFIVSLAIPYITGLSTSNTTTDHER